MIITTTQQVISLMQHRIKQRADQGDSEGKEKRCLIGT